jgi:hypothetical protein
MIRLVGKEPVMNTGAHWHPPRFYRRLRRLAANRVGAFVLLVSIVVVGLTLFISLLSTHAESVVRVAGILVLLFSPALLFATALTGAAAVRAVWRRLVDHRDNGIPQPDRPPIEKLAADLRRLLRLHDELTRSADVATHAWRLRALEGAIAICATQAARSLDVPHSDPPTPGGFVHKPQLRRLLRALAAAGLVLPPAVGLLAPDRRH